MRHNLRAIFVHESFIKKFEETIKKPHQKREKQIAKGLHQACEVTNPKGRMHSVTSILQGKVYKFHTRRKKLRVIWVLWEYHNHEIVLPVLISENLRKDFDYKKVDWEAMACNIIVELKNKQYERFELWITDGEKIKRKRLANK